MSFGGCRQLIRNGPKDVNFSVGKCDGEMSQKPNRFV